MITHYLLLIICIAIGMVVGNGISREWLFDQVWYPHLLYTLLGIGLYGAVFGIDIAELKTMKRSVVVSVTLGVAGKVIFIGSLLYLVTQNPLSYLFATIVAQIDPLSVAKLMDHNKKVLSSKGQTLLRAWSSFDDPMTVLIALYICVPLLTAQTNSLGTYLMSVMSNVLFAGIIFFLHRGVPGSKIGELVLFIIAMIVGIWGQYMLGVALMALFLRPTGSLGKVDFSWVVGHAVSGAFYLSVILVGMLFPSTIPWKEGILLGIGAYGAQVLAGLVIARTFPLRDRIFLALAQYNGITSIILATLFEIMFPGTIGVIAVALVVITLLYTLCNALGKNLSGKLMV